ncbi:alpha/beta fold hydrolase [Myxococcaceae bacterium GXIMD 01537]
MRTGLPVPSSPQDVWFPFRRSQAPARRRLFCFPFAGGSASAFHGWSAALPPDVELCALQLPGRERRLMEPAFTELPAAVDALLPVMRPLLDLPFAFLGYSMGTRFALELTRRLQRQGGPLPRGIVMAAAVPPRAHTAAPLHTLDEASFIQALRRYGGTPEQVLAHQELRELVIPSLRADFAMAWWKPAPDAEPLTCPLVVWSGTEDAHVASASVERWREETTGEIRFRQFPGGHFFLRTAKDELLAELSQELQRWLPPT